MTVKSYVTYDDAGNLTGAYLQQLHPAHQFNAIPVDDAQRLQWTAYRANAERTGLELIPPKPIDLAALSAELAGKVDSHIAGIYAGPQRFVKEYEEREAQAQAYVDAVNGRGEADPEPDVPARIAAFAAAAKLDGIDAALLTLNQANALRGALGQLADLRMRKYEIAAAETADAKQAIYDDIITKADAIARAIA